MKHTYAVDCHTHSLCSPDGHDTGAALLARAKEIGLYAWTLTDHCECQAFDEKYRGTAAQSWAMMEELTAQPAEGLKVLKGIELGQPTQNPAAAEEAARRPYDFIIGSLHNLKDAEDFYWIKYSEMTEAQRHSLLTRYWEELLETAETMECDTLGHITYPLRYIVGESGIPVDMDLYKSAVDEVFRTLIRREKALEVNTSGLRQKIGKTMPDGPLLTRYRELGGRLVTLGSDAHRTEDLGKGIDEGMEILRAAGFTEFTLYEKRQPVMLPLK